MGVEDDRERVRHLREQLIELAPSSSSGISRWLSQGVGFDYPSETSS